MSDEKARREREVKELQKAAKQKRCRTYLDDDGCEVTVTPSGHVFYNAADWW